MEDMYLYYDTYGSLRKGLQKKNAEQLLLPFLEICIYLHDHSHAFVHMVSCMLVMWLHMVLPLPHYSHSQVPEYLRINFLAVANTDRDMV